ncbi:MAG: AMP-binding protein [Christensenellaceae bacterium]
MKNYPIAKMRTDKDLRELINHAKYEGRDVFRIKTKDGYEGIKHEKVLHDINALGNALLGLGLEGKNIAVIGETSYEWIITYFAVTCGVGVIVPIDKELPEAEIANIIDDSSAACVVYSQTFDEIFENLKGQLKTVNCYIKMNQIEELIAQGEQKNLGYESKKIDEYAMSTILYTSGTTGKSKGVMLTHNSIVCASAGGLSLLEDGLGKVCMSVLPVHHSFECTHGIMMMIQNGTTICINDSLRNLLPNLQFFKPDFVFVVPLFVDMMYKKVWANIKANGKEEEMRALILKSNDLLAQGIDKRAEFFGSVKDAFGGNLSLILCGGAPLSSALAQGFREIGIDIINGYGITECSPLVAVNRRRCFKDGTVGLPIACNEIKIEHADEDGNGEIWVKGGNVMLGYYKNAAATAKAMCDGWFDTGDIGKIDEEGFLVISGRMKNLIVLANGKNIYPEEIEDYYMQIPYIKEIVVFSPLVDGLNEAVLNAEIFIDEAVSVKYTKEELTKMLEEDMKAVSKQLPFYKHVRGFKIRDKEFEKTTKKSIKRFTI